MRKNQKKPIICGIYMFTNKSNGKKYIGQSVNIWKRYKRHERKENESGIFHKALFKYGFDNFDFEILFECGRDFKLLDEQEIKFIKEYNTLNPNGYNKFAGGRFYKDPEEWIKKLKELGKESKNPWKGANHSGENNKRSRKIEDNKGSVWISIEECIKELKVIGLSAMLRGEKLMSKKVLHLDLHYKDDPNYVPMSNEKYNELLDRNRCGCNNSFSRKIGDNTGRVWDSLNQCQTELNISHLSDILNYKRPMRKDLISLDLHYIEKELESHIKVKSKTEEYKKLGLYKNCKKVADNQGRIWNSIIDAENELGIKNGLSSMLSGKTKMRKDLIHLSLHYL